jgi:hypothetical protein
MRGRVGIGDKGVNILMPDILYGWFSKIEVFNDMKRRRICREQNRKRPRRLLDVARESLHGGVEFPKIFILIYYLH